MRKSWLILAAILVLGSCNRLAEMQGDIDPDRIDGVVASEMEYINRVYFDIDGKRMEPLSSELVSADTPLFLFDRGVLILTPDAEISNGSGPAVFLEGKLEDEEFIETAIFSPLSGSFEVEESDDLIFYRGTLVSDRDERRLSLDVAFHSTYLGAGSSTLRKDGDRLYLNGDLGTKTYEQMKRAAEAYPDIETLVLEDVPGSVNDAVNVHTARIVRSAGWKTLVPSYGKISSGGVDLFCAGILREVEAGGQVGVHSWGGEPGERTARELPRWHPAHRAQLKYYTEMLGERGRDFYFFTLDAAPFDGMYWMNPEELVQWGLIGE